MNDYQKFLASKAHPDEMMGFEPLWMPKEMFPVQTHLTDWAIRKGRSSLWESCGLGKSIQELTFAENIVRKTNKNVLMLTPLAVGPQMVREGEKFGIKCTQSRNGKVHKGITVINYEQLLKFSPTDFVGVVVDESSILKDFLGKRRRQITDFLHKVKYRLLATATPSPNDYMELGTSAEALGVMGRNQMLGIFFVNGGEDTQQWELKGHARRRFWKWICTWARALTKPSDLGYDDTGFILPPLEVRQSIIKSNGKYDGFFPKLAKTLAEQKDVRRRTIKERCERVAEIIPKDDYCICWCQLNPEGDLLEELIPDSVNVQGSDSEEYKEEMLNAFAKGEFKTLITKSKIGGWGLNFQHCNRVTYFPSHSFESWHQTVRRCWRFGQKRSVYVDIVLSEEEGLVMRSMKRKERQMDEMMSELVKEMSEYQIGAKKCEHQKERMILPTWL